MGRQEWTRFVERDRDVLERILSLLLALAALVDRAACLPAARRPHLLAILGHGEAEARSLVLALVPDACAGAPVETAVTPYHDAALIAAGFRMLALSLGVLLAQARSPCRCALLPLLPTLLPGCRPRRIAQGIPSPAVRATSPPCTSRAIAYETGACLE